MPRRPAQPQDQPTRQARVAVLPIRWTADERAMLDERAAALGVSVSAYVRAAALTLEPPRPKGRQRPTTEPNLTPAELRELNAIGVNLNQIARHLNGGGVDDDGAVSPALAQLDAIFRRFLR